MLRPSCGKALEGIRMSLAIESTLGGIKATKFLVGNKRRDKMSKNEEEREIHLKVTNVELTKLVKKKMAENRTIREENRLIRGEMEKLRLKVSRRSFDDSEDEKEDEQIQVPQDPRKILVDDQRIMIETLERLGRRDMKPNILMSSGRLNLEECMD